MWEAYFGNSAQNVMGSCHVVSPTSYRDDIYGYFSLFWVVPETFMGPLVAPDTRRTLLQEKRENIVFHVAFETGGQNPPSNITWPYETQEGSARHGEGY